ncbi:MAG: hypothetical protein CMG24_03280 [Candidatus Marinimicrobia bacterium]|jgi:hypothetical protein|nr:hypothetical protein [Candidatus Neomarinimicrobiota bacterium]|tara:strand:- start:203 stop:1621 length:1419 start_codon:yes stop_codon:yes gene_type:complete
MKNIIIYILFANLIFTQTNFSISSSILDDGLDQNSGTISFLVNTDYDIYGYQFSITNINLDSCTDPNNTGFNISGESSGTIIGFSFSGSFISSGSYTLLECIYTNHESSSDDGICISDVSISDGGFGSAIPSEQVVIGDCLYTDICGSFTGSGVCDCGNGSSSCECCCQGQEDACGVCNGTNQPNTGNCDCLGIPNGDAIEDCEGNCNGNAELDLCGVCNGECTNEMHDMINCNCSLVIIDGIETLQCTGNCEINYHDNPCYAWNFEPWTDQVDLESGVANQIYDEGEQFEDSNNNGFWDTGCFDCLGNELYLNETGFTSFNSICQNQDPNSVGLSYCYEDDSAIDNNSCYPLVGCTDQAASNYDLNHIFDDGSCLLSNSDLNINRFSLNNVYPNPFNPNIKIHFSVSEFSFIEIDIYNMNGQKVDNINSDYLMPGTYEFEWIPEAQISSGNYFLFIKDSNQHLSQIVTYLK